MHIKICLCFVILVAVFYTVSASVSRFRASKEHPGKCWTGEKEYDVGKHYPEGQCHVIHCSSDFSGSTEGCGTVVASKGFHVERDATKKHPDCCPKLVKDKA